MNDPVQSEGSEAVWTWSEWAKTNGRDGKDVGIDLVAKLRNEAGFAAIQAKFYAADARIQKAHIDSFISASGKEPFSRRVVLDTTEKEWGTNAEEMIRDQAIPVVRIGLTDLRESRIDWTIFEARGEIVLSAKKSTTGPSEGCAGGRQQGPGGGGSRQDNHGLRHRQDLHGAEDRRGHGRARAGASCSWCRRCALMSQTMREWTIDSQIAAAILCRLFGQSRLVSAQAARTTWPRSTCTI